MNRLAIALFFGVICAVDVEMVPTETGAVADVFRDPLFIKALHENAGHGAFTEFASTRQDVRNSVLSVNGETVIFRKAMSSAMRRCPGPIFHVLNRAVKGEQAFIDLEYLNILERCIEAIENVCAADSTKSLFKGAIRYDIPEDHIHETFLRLSQVCKVSLEFHDTKQLQRIPPENVNALYVKSKLSREQEEVLRSYLTTCKNLDILDLHEVELNSELAIAIPSRLTSLSHGNSNGAAKVSDDSLSWNEIFTRLDKLVILRKYSISQPSLSDAILNKLPRALQVLSLADEPNLKMQHLKPLHGLVSLKNSKLGATGQITLPRSLKTLDLEGRSMADEAFVLNSFTMEAIRSSSLSSLSFSYLTISAETLSRLFAALPGSLRRLEISHNEVNDDDAFQEFSIFPENSLQEIVFTENVFGTLHPAETLVKLLQASPNLVTLTIYFPDNDDLVRATLRDFIYGKMTVTIKEFKEFKEFKIKDPGEQSFFLRRLLQELQRRGTRVRYNSLDAT